jgi:hypothetical protein
MNVTHHAEPVPDTQRMNVSTVGAEPRRALQDAARVVEKDGHLTETSVSSRVASKAMKAVTPAARANVSIVHTGMTFGRVNAMNALRKIVRI